MSIVSAERLGTYLEKVLSCYAAQLGFEKVVILAADIVNSLVATSIACNAVGSSSVAVIAPDNYPGEFYVFCNRHGVELYKVNVENMIRCALSMFKQALMYDKEAKKRFEQTALAMAAVMYSQTQENCVIVSPLDKTDLILGLFEPVLESVANIHILGDVYKSKVYELASYYAIPDKLMKYRTETLMGIDLATVDKIIECITEYKMDIKRIVQEIGTINEEDVRNVVQKIVLRGTRAEKPLILKIGTGTRGIEWRVPRAHKLPMK